MSDDAITDPAKLADRIEAFTTREDDNDGYPRVPADFAFVELDLIVRALRAMPDKP